MAGRAGHLVRRFLGSLRPGGPPAREQRWVADVLAPEELALWNRLPGPDRRHSAQVARRVERALGHEATPPVLAAALLHDVGKLESGLRVPGRVLATLVVGVLGRARVLGWRRGRGLRRRFALYVDHPRLGRDLLRLAGSDPLTSTWAAEHHDPPEAWSVPEPLAVALHEADDD